MTESIKAKINLQLKRNTTFDIAVEKKKTEYFCRNTFMFLRRTNKSFRRLSQRDGVKGRGRSRMVEKRFASLLLSFDEKYQ